MTYPGILVHPSATTSLSRGWKYLVVSRYAVARHRPPIGSRNNASPMTVSPYVRSHNRVHRITISIFGLDRVRREREGREETSGEEGRPMIDIELIRIIVGGGGGGEDCKGLKINKNGGWESETDG